MIDRLYRLKSAMSRYQSMPELPEVETIRRDLEGVILGQKIARVSILLPRMVEGDLAALKGDSFVSIGRRGKLLMLKPASNPLTLLLHLKMTGQLICQIEGGIIAGGHPQAKIDDLPNKYTRLIFEFANGVKLFFNDVRSFGYAKLVDEKQVEQALAKFGIEPLTADFTFEQFLKVLIRRKAPLKTILLNQQLIAGLGNIYVDEVCHQAGVLPARGVQTLNPQEKTKIFEAIEEIIKLAVDKRGTTFSNYVDAAGKKGGFLEFLQVYKRDGQKCNQCKSATIQKIRLAGRGTHFCPACQI